MSRHDEILEEARTLAERTGESRRPDSYLLTKADYDVLQHAPESALAIMEEVLSKYSAGRYDIRKQAVLKALVAVLRSGNAIRKAIDLGREVADEVTKAGENDE